jgi:hypothetical protein
MAKFEEDDTLDCAGVCKDCGNGTLNNRLNEAFDFNGNGVYCLNCGSLRNHIFSPLTGIRLIEVARIPASLARVHTNNATIEDMKIYLEDDNAKSE